MQELHMELLMCAQRAKGVLHQAALAAMISNTQPLTLDMFTSPSKFQRLQAHAYNPKAFPVLYQRQPFRPRCCVVSHLGRSAQTGLVGRSVVPSKLNLVNSTKLMLTIPCSLIHLSNI